MNKKIERVREELRKTQAKLRELEEYQKTLEIRERQLCDEEVAKVIRGMTGKGGDVLDTLQNILEDCRDENAGEADGSKVTGSGREERDQNA